MSQPLAPELIVIAAAVHMSQRAVLLSQGISDFPTWNRLTASQKDRVIRAVWGVVCNGQDSIPGLAPGYADLAKCLHRILRDTNGKLSRRYA